MRFSFQSQVMSAALQIETSVENGVSQPELEENRNHWQHTAIDSSLKRYIIYIFHCLAVVIVAISSCSSGEHKIVDCHARRALRYMSTIRFSLPIRQYQIHCAIVEFESLPHYVGCCCSCKQLGFCLHIDTAAYKTTTKCVFCRIVADNWCTIERESPTAGLDEGNVLFKLFRAKSARFKSSLRRGNTLRMRGAHSFTWQDKCVCQIQTVLGELVPGIVTHIHTPKMRAFEDFLQTSVRATPAHITFYAPQNINTFHRNGKRHFPCTEWSIYIK